MHACQLGKVVAALSTVVVGIGKATVEVLDKGKETPRNTFPSEAAAPPAHRSCGGTKETQQVSQVSCTIDLTSREPQLIFAHA